MRINKATKRLIVDHVGEQFNFTRGDDGRYIVSWKGHQVGIIKRVGRFQEFIPTYNWTDEQIEEMVRKNNEMWANVVW